MTPETEIHQQEINYMFNNYGMTLQNCEEKEYEIRVAFPVVLL
jgi:hypothetical protein